MQLERNVARDLVDVRKQMAAWFRGRLGPARGASVSTPTTTASLPTNCSQLSHLSLQILNLISVLLPAENISRGRFWPLLHFAICEAVELWRKKVFHGRRSKGPRESILCNNLSGLSLPKESNLETSRRSEGHRVQCDAVSNRLPDLPVTTAQNSSCRRTRTNAPSPFALN